MSDTITLEAVQKSAVEAMQAFVDLKSDIAPKLEKLDAIDAEKADKMEKSISDAIEKQQAFNSRALAIEEKQKQFETTLSRPNLDAKAASDAVEHKRSDAFNMFLKHSATERGDFADFIERKGDLPEEVKTLAVNSQADGGYLVMPQFGGIINVRAFETSPIRQLANIVNISTDSYELVLDNDEAASGWVSEEGTRPSTGTPKLGKKIIPTHEMYAKPLATQKMLDDSIVNVEQWLAKKVADKFARDEATAFVKGDGVGKPMGILANTTTSTDYDAANVQIVASAVRGEISYDDLINLTNALKEAYQPGSTFLYKRATNKSILKIKDGESTPIFNLQYTQNGGLQPSILGTRVLFADDMPAVANDANAITFGDVAEGYTIVDRIGIRVLRDPYSAKPYVEFYTTKRVGGDVVNAEALKILGLTG